MIVVDTSVWIDYFNDTATPQVKRLRNALGMEIVAIGDMIALEILQGFKNDKDYRSARGMIDALTVFELRSAGHLPLRRQLPDTPKKRHHRPQIR